MELPDAKKFLETDNDEFGTNSFRIGAAMLLPFANRIRGKLSDDGKTIATTILGHPFSLPANFHGKNPGAELHSIHGFIYDAKFENVKQNNGPIESTVSAILHGGNFGGHWPSDTDVNLGVTLKNLPRTSAMRKTPSVSPSTPTSRSRAATASRLACRFPPTSALWSIITMTSFRPERSSP
jgi:hypothetical protein